MDLHPENNRIFAELAGVCWHEINLETPYMIDGVRVGKLYTCSCGIKVHKTGIKEHTENFNPQYAADPWLVLREMGRIGKLGEFLSYLCRINSMPDCNGSIPAYYLLDLTGKLRDAAIEWIKEKEK